MGSVGPDEARLGALSTFHVKRPLLQVRLRAPVSPHLAAREEGRTIVLDDVVREVAELRSQVAVILELPGGLFSPLSRTETNADLASLLHPDILLLVAPNRIGVLHDVRAVLEACGPRGLRLAGVVLSATASDDASSLSNAAELTATTGLPVLASLTRAPIEELVASGALDALARCCGLAREHAALQEPVVVP